MANTTIKFLRGAGMPTGRAFVDGNAGTLNYCEPWVNTNAKQLWVDNVCINPHLAIDSNDSTYLSLAYAQDTTSKEVTLTVSLNEAALASYILGTSAGLVISKSGSEDTVYNPTNGGTIVLGSGLSYDASTNTISADIIESFLSGVEIVAGSDIPTDDRPSGWASDKTYMHFTFTTQGSPAATEIYVDVTSFYDDTDTVTKIAGVTDDDVVVTLSGSFTTDAENTYTITHKNITTTPSSDAATAQYGGTISVIDNITVANGHVTGYNTKTITLPASDDTTYNLDADVPTGGASFNINLNGSDNSTDTVNIKHAAQASGVGSKMSFSASQNEITMQIDEIDGGTF